MTEQALSPSGVWALVLASAVLMGSPGPSTMSVVAVGAAFGLRRSLGYVAGLILGTTAVLLAVATGIVAVLLSIPTVAPALTGASVAYMLFLAVQIARAPPLSRQSPAVVPPSLSGGMLLAVAYPKAYAAIAAVFGGATLTGSPPAAEAPLKTAILGTMIVAIHAGWLLAGASLSRAPQNPAASRIANLVFAGMLAAASVFTVLH